ncbi:MAG: C2H2-type zinc finger protein, partial [Nitrososphaerales archaeon]
SKQAYKCNTCGASFNSQEELMSHGRMHMKGGQTQQFKCEACGATFDTQSKLMEHAKSAHPMQAK